MLVLRHGILKPFCWVQAQPSIFPRDLGQRGDLALVADGGCTLSSAEDRCWFPLRPAGLSEGTGPPHTPASAPSVVPGETSDTVGPAGGSLPWDEDAEDGAEEPPASPRMLRGSPALRVGHVAVVSTGPWQEGGFPVLLQMFTAWGEFCCMWENPWDERVSRRGK